MNETPEILEDKSGWKEHFRQNWMAHLKQTGEVNWSLYRHPRNISAPGSPGVKLGASRLLMITSAGAHLRGKQSPFDAPNPYGDYSFRTFPSDVDLSVLAYAHGHYDQTMIEADPQVGVPLKHLDDLVRRGMLGGIAPDVVSFMGYQPDSARVVDELVPEIVRLAIDLGVQAALLAPV